MTLFDQGKIFYCSLPVQNQVTVTSWCCYIVARVFWTVNMCCVVNREFLFVTKGVARAFWIFAYSLKIKQIRQHRCHI